MEASHWPPTNHRACTPEAGPGHILPAAGGRKPTLPPSAQGRKGPTCEAGCSPHKVDRKLGCPDSPVAHRQHLHLGGPGKRVEN